MAQNLEDFSKFITENKGKRKFKQSVELAVNFKGIDFSKQANRLNLDVMLPNGRGRTSKVAVFATDKGIVENASKSGIEVIDGNRLDALATDQSRLNSLLDYELLAQPNLMPSIAKYLGQFLGPRNKMPKPLLGNANVANMASDLNKKITIRNKGKYVPTIHCVVGNEDMEAKALYENVNEVISEINKKVGPNHIRSAYVKMTMSGPMKVA